MFFVQLSSFMFQLYKNIQTDFLGQIFLELFHLRGYDLFSMSPHDFKENAIQQKL